MMNNSSIIHRLSYINYKLITKCNELSQRVNQLQKQNEEHNKTMNDKNKQLQIIMERYDIPPTVLLQVSNN